MRVRTVLVAINILLLGAISAGAADHPADTAAVKASPAAVKTPRAADKAHATAVKGAIVGKWKSVDDGEVMDFAADGSAHVLDPNSTFIGTYEIAADGVLHLDMPAFGKHSIFDYAVELKGDELTLTLKDHKPRKYDRMK